MVGVDDGRFKQLIDNQGRATVARIQEYGAMRVIERWRIWIAHSSRSLPRVDGLFVGA